MSNAHPSPTLQIHLNLSELNVKDCIQLGALIGTFAPTSAVCTAKPTLKDAADAVIKDGAALDAADKDMEAKKQAYLASISARAALRQQFSTDAAVLKSLAHKLCKTEQDIQSLGFNRRPPRAAPSPLVCPVTILATPGKAPGSILLHALRMPGLYKYVAEISLEPTQGFQPLPGTTATRKLEGYVSGQQYWIRFATERGVTRSAWSEPVPVVAR